MSQSTSERASFHGWRVAFVSAVANAAAMGLGTLNLGLFVQPMEADIDVSRTVFGSAGSVRQVAGAVTSPFIGRMIDRHGVRWLLPIVTVITCLCLAALAWIDAGWQLLLVFGVIGLCGMIGPGQLLTNVPVTKWFVQLRPKAIAYMSLGIPVGAMVFMPLTQYLIDTFGWRQAWVGLAILGVLIICPICLLWMRREPEDHGQQPDGGMATDNLSDHTLQEYPWTLEQARRQPVFWLIAFTMGMVAFAISTIAFHRLPEFVDKGLDPMVVGLAIAWDAVLAGMATFGVGMLGGRVHVRWVGLVGFTCLGLGVIGTIYVTDFTTLIIAMTVWGLGIGVMMFVSNLIWAEYFGRANAGTIRGFVTPITLLLGASGGPIAGFIYDNSGSYDIMWWVSAGLMFLSALTIACSKPPVPPSSSI